MFNINYVFIVFAVVVIAIGQITFKFAARSLRFLPSQPPLALLRDNALPLSLVALALFLYLLSTLAWVQALRTVPLSIAFMFNALAFIVVPVAGFLLFGEPVPRFFLPGIVLIIAGIVLVAGW
jgi:multidrug transporter EmrE-like cation transporter